MTRSECDTLKNGPCDVSRRCGDPVQSKAPSLDRNSDREKGTLVSIVSHRVGCMPRAHLEL